MTLRVRAELTGFGAEVLDVDLAQPLAADTVADIRQVWINHQIVYFPNQKLTHRQLEQFTTTIGDYGYDPYIKPVEGHSHILEVRQEPDEPVAPFGSSWHSDWSFQATPPSATILHAKVIPPIGGDTLFADGYRAYDDLSDTLKDEIETLYVVHSARRAYSHEAFESSGAERRTMTIVPSHTAWQTEIHPLVRTHAESGRRTLWVNPVYSISIQNWSTFESDKLLKKLFTHCLQEKYIYRHKWAKHMLCMWDNRCVQHCAQGGYAGYQRVLHRTIVAGEKPC